MVQNHRVSMIPRTKFSVCEGGTIGKRKEPLLRSEIFTELEVSQFFLIFWITAQELWEFEEAWFRKVGAAGRSVGTAAERRLPGVNRGDPMTRASFRW